MPDINLIPHPLVGTPFGTALDLCVILAGFCWLAGAVTREYSWVDRLWSIAPPVYCLIVAVASDFESPRVNLMTALVVLWGARLTWNYARKGGYWKGGEDYRWAVIRGRFGPVTMQLMNVTFISPGQMLLIWWFTSPIHQAWLHSEEPLGELDLAVAALFLAFLVLETVADEQMWSFQQARKRKIEAGGDDDQPFLTTGLRRYVRHPNYLGELGMWWVFYLFGVMASGQPFHWTGLGLLALTALFVGSIRLTEAISASKYPAWAEYRASVPCLVRLPWSGKARAG